MLFKGKVLFQWFLILILSSQIFYIGSNILIGDLNCYLLSTGISQSIIISLGIIELISTITILFKRYRFLTAFVQIFIICGIMFTDMGSIGPLTLLLNISNIGFLAIILWFEKDMEYLEHEVIQQHSQL
jgi:hypothetical protein